MTKLRRFALFVVFGHWFIAVWHLYLAANVLAAPNNKVSWLAITFISAGHLAVAIVLWELGDKLAGSVGVIFFLAALGADLYEHFLHPSANNIFMVAPGNWTARFDASVFALLALEVLGCVLAILLLGGGERNNRQPQLANHGAGAAAKI
jgi:hypothetical protein